MNRTSTHELLDLAPPHNLDDEQSLLGSVFRDPDKLDEVALIVRPEDFYLGSNRTLYETMLALHNSGKSLEERLIVSVMKRAGTLQDVATIRATASEQELFDSAMAYISETAESVPTGNNAAYYAQNVRDSSLLRSLVFTGSEMIHEGHCTDGSPRERLARVESKIFKLLDTGTQKTIRPVRDILIEAIAEIDERVNRGTVSGISTGYFQLDSVMGGMRPGELIVIAARPSHGKSALAANIIEHVGMQHGLTCLMVSLEMSSQELMERMLSSVSKIDGHTIRNGFLRKEDMPAIVEAQNRISQAPMFVDEDAQRNVVEISSAARRMRRTDHLALLVIDYLQLIEPDNRRESREQQVAVISRRLKQLARELKIPVVCLAQLNRDVETDKDRIPKLRHLRESGAIEQDADVVLFVHREDMYRVKDFDNKALIRISKNRNGQRGEIELAWNPGCTRFDNPDTEWNPDEHRYPGADF